MWAHGPAWRPSGRTVSLRHAPRPIGLQSNDSKARIPAHFAVMTRNSATPGPMAHPQAPIILYELLKFPFAVLPRERSPGIAAIPAHLHRDSCCNNSGWSLPCTADIVRQLVIVHLSCLCRPAKALKLLPHLQADPSSFRHLCSN